MRGLYGEDLIIVFTERNMSKQKKAGTSAEELTNSLLKTGNPGRVVVSRIKSGSDLLRSLQEIIEEKELKSGVILSGVGLLSSVKLRNCKTLPDEFPITDQNRSYLSFEKPSEIIGISGNVGVADGKPLIHAHLTLSYIEDEAIKVIGGHMIEGSMVFGFAEVIIMELTEIEMIKIIDKETKTLQYFS